MRTIQNECVAFFETIEVQCLKKTLYSTPQLDTPFPGVDGLIEYEKKNFDAFPGF